MRRKDALAILVATSLTAVMAAPSLAVDDLSLNVTPATECVSAGQTITVTLDVASLSAAVNGVQVLLHYDNTLLTLIDVVPTDLGLTPPDEGWVVNGNSSSNPSKRQVPLNGNSSSWGSRVWSTMTLWPSKRR